MTSEMLSIIQSACLAVSGLMAAAITVITIWQSAKRPAVDDPQRLGGLLEKKPVDGGCPIGRRNPAPHSSKQVSAMVQPALARPTAVPANCRRSGRQAGTAAARAGRHADRSDSVPEIQADIPIATPADLTGTLLVVNGCGSQRQCRVWFWVGALPKRTSTGYAIAVAREEVAIVQA